MAKVYNHRYTSSSIFWSFSETFNLLLIPTMREKIFQCGWTALYDNDDQGNTNDVYSLVIFFGTSSGNISGYLAQDKKLCRIQPIGFDAETEVLIIHTQLL